MAINTNAIEQHLVNQMATIDRIVDQMNELPDGVELSKHAIENAGHAMEQALISFELLCKRGEVTLEQALWTDPIR